MVRPLAGVQYVRLARRGIEHRVIPVHQASGRRVFLNELDVARLRGVGLRATFMGTLATLAGRIRWPVGASMTRNPAHGSTESALPRWRWRWLALSIVGLAFGGS